MNHVSPLVSAYAVLLALCGGALLFLPDVVGSWLSGERVPSNVLFQMLGAAFLGFGAATWVARRSLLGGIYGRAVVTGNLTFALIAALVLLRGVPDQPRIGYWILLAVLLAGTVLFGGLMFRGPRFEKE